MLPTASTFASFGVVPALTNRQILLRRRPTGLVQPDDTELVASPAPEPAEGEALVRTTYVGIDAAARTWLDDQPSYLPPVQLGEVIRAAGIGEVVASRCDAYAVGDVVTTLTGFQDYVIIRDDIFATPVVGLHRPAGGDVDLRPDRCHCVFRHDRYRPTAARGDGRRLSRGGSHRFGRRADRTDRRGPGGRHRRRSGEVPGRRRRLRFRRVHRLQESSDLAAALKATLSARCRRLLRQRGRPDPRCGVGPPGAEGAGGAVRCHLELSHRRASGTGQLREPAVRRPRRCRDSTHSTNGAASTKHSPRCGAGSRRDLLAHRETVFDGLESCVDALNGLFTGANIGKMLVKVSEPTPA